MNNYLIAGIVVLIVMIALAISLANRARRLAIQNEELSENPLAEFEQMRESGEISEEEFRRMKKIIAEKTVRKAKGK